MLAFLDLVLAAASLGLSLALATQLRALRAKLAAIERRPERVPLEERHDRKGEPWGRELAIEEPLADLRIGLDIRQDHPHPVFANLLKEALSKQDVAIDDAHPDLRIEGEIVGNGYADVYFRAELRACLGEETLFTLSDKPPHGDRPANLVAEVVQRLRDEMGKRERHLAVWELHQRG